MHKAAQGGQLEVIKFLAPTFGARVHEKDEGSSYTALHWACQEGYCDVARYLIEELKLDPQARDKVCEMVGRGELCSEWKSSGIVSLGYFIVGSIVDI